MSLGETWDDQAYAQVCRDLERWKARALRAEEALGRYIEQDNPTFMGEPVLRSDSDHGYTDLWRWFGCSRASWLVVPRAFMHAMPDWWQSIMARLLSYWDEEWEWPNEVGIPQVGMKQGGRYIKVPDYLTNYRHPTRALIERLRRSRE